MMRLLHTSSRLAALLLLTIPMRAADVRGEVEVLSDTRDKRARAQSIADVIVWLQATTGSPVPTGTGERARMLQKDKTFIPHVLPIRVGTVVDFPNADPIFHNAFSNYDGELFDVALYPPGTTRSVRFRRPGIVRVFCNIHPAMSAIIMVLDTPYFAKLGSDGTYTIRQVPPGTYELHVFDERATHNSEKASVLRVTTSDVSAPRISISEVGYAQMPHKNKYGDDYGPVHDSYEVPAR